MSRTTTQKKLEQLGQLLGFLASEKMFELYPENKPHVVEDGRDTEARGRAASLCRRLLLWRGRDGVTGGGWRGHVTSGGAEAARPAGRHSLLGPAACC